MKKISVAAPRAAEHRMERQEDDDDATGTTVDSRPLPLLKILEAARPGNRIARRHADFGRNRLLRVGYEAGERPRAYMACTVMMRLPSLALDLLFRV